MDILNTCIITDQPIRGFTEIDGGFEYVTDVNNVQLKLKFASMNWQEKLTPQYKILLKALYFRKEWPFDLDSLLSIQLIDRYVRIYQNKAFPAMDDFNAKALFYLEWIYNNGGKLNKQLTFKPSEYFVAFANDEEEFSRVYEELQFKEYITIKSDTEFKLSAQGKKVVEKIITDRPQKREYEFSNHKNPRILIFNDEKDKSFSKKLKDLFMATTSIGDIKKRETFSSSFVRSARRALKRKDEFTADYFLFIKSKESDSNNTYGSVLNIAAETHLELGVGLYPRFISIVAIDDSYFEAWPTYDEYHSSFYDVRVTMEQERLVSDILANWANRLDNTIKTHEGLLIWLKEQRKNFNNNSFLLRPTQLSILIESESFLEIMLEKLEAEKIIRLRKGPGCKGDKYEYEVVLIEEDADSKGNSFQELKVELPERNINTVQNLLTNFHKIVTKLGERRENRSTLQITDEYDVQDLLYALFQINFLDVRKEEYNINNVGRNSRIDFVLRNEDIVVEVKWVSKDYRDAQIGDDLLKDIGRYKSHPNCKTLVIFIYDKDYYLLNRHGLISDLEKQSTPEVRVRAFISPV